MKASTVLHMLWPYMNTSSNDLPCNPPLCVQLSIEI